MFISSPLLRLLRAGLGLTLAIGVTLASAQPQKPPLRIGAANSTDHAVAFIGVERGIFAKHGLDANSAAFSPPNTHAGPPR